jgi:hypothetical protein
MHINKRVLGGMARAYFVDAWAQCEEDDGRSYPGQDMCDVAPETAKDAYNKALYHYAEIEAATRARAREISTLIRKLGSYLNEPAQTDAIPQCIPIQQEVDRLGIDQEYGDEEYTFGWYLGMESLGHGVTWADDHDPHRLVIPLVDSLMYSEIEE